MEEKSKKARYAVLAAAVIIAAAIFCTRLVSWQIFSSDYPSYIYYTYTTAGYLRDNKAATLISVDNEKITVSKYSNGAVTSLYAGEGAKSQFSDTYDTGATHVIKRVRNKQQLKPGKTATVTVTVDTSAFNEEVINVPLTLLCNDPNKPQTTIRLVGIIE